MIKSNKSVIRLARLLQRHAYPDRSERYNVDRANLCFDELSVCVAEHVTAAHRCNRELADELRGILVSVWGAEGETQ